MATYRVTKGSMLTAGTIAAAGRGDVVLIARSAATCPGWAVISQAAMIAFARGAHVVMGDGS